MSLRNPTDQPIIALKLLREDGGSLGERYRRVFYPLGVKVEVAGCGAFVGVNPNGLVAGGDGPVLAYMRCEQRLDETGTRPDGVHCYRYVTRIEPCPDGLSPALQNFVAAWSGDQDALVRILLDPEADPYLAFCADHRFGLALWSELVEEFGPSGEPSHQIAMTFARRRLLDVVRKHLAEFRAQGEQPSEDGGEG